MADWSKVIIAAEVDPVGRKAYWSARQVKLEGMLRIGYMLRLTMAFSKHRERMDVTDMGL